MIGREDEVRSYRERTRLFSAIVLIAFAVVTGRLIYLQVIRGNELRQFSDANRLKKEKLFPTRGVLFDRHGKIIVENRASFDVVVLSQYYRQSETTDARLAKALQMPLEELEKRLEKLGKTPSYYPILLKSDVSKDIIAAIETDAESFPGVDIEANVQRKYHYGELAAQLLGYVAEVDNQDLKTDKRLEQGDLIGRTGLERMYDAHLRGKTGAGYVEVDAMGRRRKSERGEKLLGFTAQTDPVPGNNIYLTIDADLEEVAAKEMNSRGYIGSVVALDPRSGEILVWLNLPSYDPEKISRREVSPKVWAELRENKDRPLRNRAIQDHYPPGSTFKPLVAIAALAEGNATQKTSVNCYGSIPFGNRRFNCWKKHGGVDFMRAIRESCDVFFYTVSNHVGIDNIAKYARLFGLGRKTGIALSNEQRGLIPDSEWKKKTYHDVWHAGETLSVGIGQGYVAVTPLQLVTAYAAIANGGFVYKPYVVQRIVGRSGEVLKEFHPEVTKVELPTEVFQMVKEGLHQVVNVPGGTAYGGGRSKKADISGKTGTAQVKHFADISQIKKCENLPRNERHHAWFVGYAPRENPQIAVVALGEHACHSAYVTPIVRAIIEAYMDKQNPAAAKENSAADKTTSTVSHASTETAGTNAPPEGD